MPVEDNSEEKMKRVICRAAALLLAAALFLPSCGKTKKRYSVTYTEFFDTVTNFTAYCVSESQFDRAEKAVRDKLGELHRLFDIYNEYDGTVNLATVNRLAGDGVPVPEAIGDLLSVYGLFWYDTGGLLDPALGPVLRIWHDCREKGVLPDTDALEAADEHASFNRVFMSDGVVRFEYPDMSLDVGAVAKGYASGAAAGAAREAGVSDFVLDLGGNVLVSGKKPDGDWTVGVTDPTGEGFITKLAVTDASVVTSGDYQRYFEVDGVRYHHIIDPFTLMPATRYRAVTVICRDPAYADALSTSLFLMDEAGGAALCRKYGAEALWIRADGTISKTEGFSSYER